jgi:hypothetical protein
MGLDVSHDAFRGAYSAFFRLREFVCAATGGTYDSSGYTLGQTFIEEGANWQGLVEFLSHSDCDGEIDPEMCTEVANNLTALLPRMEEMEMSSKWLATGHIAMDGGYVAVVKQFIAGCRAAAEAGEPLVFG